MVLGLLLASLLSCSDSPQPGATATPSEFTQLKTRALKRVETTAYELALPDLEKAIALEPNDKDIQYALFLSYRFEKDKEKATEAAGLVIDSFPEGSEQAEQAHSYIHELESQRLYRQLKGHLSKGEEEKAWKLLGEIAESEESFLGERFALGRKFEPPGPDTVTYRTAKALVGNGQNDRYDRLAQIYLRCVDLKLHESPEACLWGLVEAAPKAQRRSDIGHFLIKKDESQTHLLESLAGTKVKVLASSQKEDRASLKLELTVTDLGTEQSKTGRGVAAFRRQEGFWLLDPEASNVSFGLTRLAQPSLEISGQEIKGVVKLGEGIGRVTARLGEPDRIVKIPEERRIQEYIYSREGFALGVRSGIVREIIITSPAVRTREGLGIGNTLGDYRDAYGLKKPKVTIALGSIYKSLKEKRTAWVPARLNEYYEGHGKFRQIITLHCLDVEGAERFDLKTRVHYISLGHMSY